MTKTTFKTAKRSDRKAKQIRRDGLVPANVYIPHKDSIALEIKPQEFKKLFEEVGETGLVYLEIEGEKKAVPALIDQIDIDYLSNDYEHVVFRGVNLKEKIKAKVPVEIVGEFEVEEAVLITVQDEVEVEALPTDFPEKFELDVSKFKEVGDSYVLTDLDFDKDEVTLVLGEDDDPSEIVLVSVQEQAEEEPEEEVVDELVEPEVIGEEKEAEATEETAEPATEKEE